MLHQLHSTAVQKVYFYSVPVRVRCSYAKRYNFCFICNLLLTCSFLNCFIALGRGSIFLKFLFLAKFYLFFGFVKRGKGRFLVAIRAEMTVERC